MNKKKSKFNFFFQYLLNISKQKKAKGFTLTELLIAVFTSAIVISALLTAMVQILQSDRRESQRTQRQQEVQSALNYITQDLKQAVYVYDTSDIAQYIPDLSAQNATPVLVFWKTEKIEDKPELDYTVKQCEDTFTGTTDKDKEELARCKNLLLKRSQYVLIAYYQSTKNDNTVWEGNSRILRYRLPKYSDLTKRDLKTKITSINKGYVDPSSISNNFTDWPIKDKGSSVEQNLQALNRGRPTALGDLPVLVDFIDSPDSDDFKDPKNDIQIGTTKETTTRLDCSTLPRIKDPDNPSKFIDRYERIPPNNNDVADSETGIITNLIPFSSNSFYVCVRTNDNTNSLVGTKQSIAIYLRGNELTKVEVENRRQELGNKKTKVFGDTFLPAVQTQITIGGIIEK